MFVNRIIHPVGQGAFYSEKIHINNQSFNIVYDCGSNTSYKVNGKKKVVQTEVRSYYHKEETINLLFISHFDNDHVNGLEYLKDHCNIKCVIMPLLTPSARLGGASSSSVLSSVSCSFKNTLPTLKQISSHTCPIRLFKSRIPRHAKNESWKPVSKR